MKKHIIICIIFLLAFFLASLGAIRCHLSPGLEEVSESLIAQRVDYWKKYREQMLILINNDRKRNGLNSVELDEFASYFGQIHANEMAKYNYLSHWALDGTKPYVRWSRLGGRDHLQENVGFFGVTGKDIMESFSMEIFQNDFMNSPGHRANILERYHTHVGIGIAINRATGTSYVAQEFVDRCVWMYPFSTTVKKGDKVTLTGKMIRSDLGPYVCVVTYEPFPAPMSVDELRKTSLYEDYGISKLPLICPWHITFDRVTGNFWVPINFPQDASPGIYYSIIYVKEKIDTIPYRIVPGMSASVTTAEAIPATSIVFELK